jgi:hypothetical protein
MSSPTFFDLARSIDNELKGNFRCPDQTFVVGTYPVTSLLYTLLGDCTGGDVVFDLPTAVGLSGMRFTFKKIDASANLVRINADGAETIDGAASIQCTQQNDSFQIESDGANWIIVARVSAASNAGIVVAEVEETGGEFSTASLTFVAVTGTLVNFTLDEPTTIRAYSEFTPFKIGLDTDKFDYYGIEVDGTTYPKGDSKASAFVGTANYAFPAHVEKMIQLAAGAHTVQLMARSNGTHLSRIQSSADAPTVTGVEYVSGGGGSGSGDVVAARTDATGVATTDAYATAANKTSTTGILGIGTLKNTGAQGLTVRETGVDAFGNTDSTETPVAAGDSVMLDPTQNFGSTAFPPYTQYTVEVKSTTPGSPTTYSVRLLTQAAP